jgi:hypothetical protein
LFFCLVQNNSVLLAAFVFPTEKPTSFAEKLNHKTANVRRYRVESYRNPSNHLFFYLSSLSARVTLCAFGVSFWPACSSSYTTWCHTTTTSETRINPRNKDRTFTSSQSCCVPILCLPSYPRNELLFCFSLSVFQRIFAHSNVIVFFLALISRIWSKYMHVPLLERRTQLLFRDRT